MRKENLEQVDQPYEKEYYTIRDSLSQVLSLYDFPINHPNFLDDYSDFQNKINRRITRFIYSCQNHSNVLFVRFEGKPDQASKEAIMNVLRSLDEIRSRKKYTLLYIYREKRGFPAHPNVSYYFSSQKGWRSDPKVWDTFLLEYHRKEKSE